MKLINETGPKSCYMCDNAKVNDELTDENDLSYISIGKSGGSHRMFIRAGDGKPIQILVEQFIKDDWHLAAIYEPLYCPNCGRKLIEQEAENEADK